MTLGESMGSSVEGETCWLTFPAGCQIQAVLEHAINASLLVLEYETMQEWGDSVLAGLPWQQAE
ncbi:Uncharacterized protein DAT39_014163 [Clarias magur]|uniref:Uncharacterized protein n=1 Tax=Clarias magur TaxID=1594786 RepID=A0A8J4UJR9_CLAMG|nr:Uncharacterized protein DAT39_014163 [Clarias magur]